MSALIGPLELAVRLREADVVVLDVQYNLVGTAGAALYAQGHLPGAVFVDLDRVLAGPPGTAGRHPLPDPAQLQDGLRAAGVGRDSTVVAYDQRSSLASARAWWLLRWAGHPAVRVLDGGLTAWTTAGLPVTTQVPDPPAGDIVVRPGSLPVLDADAAASLARHGVLLDVRAGERYRGEVEPIDPVAGHIPGSVNLPMTDLLEPDGRFRPAAQLRRIAAQAGVFRDTPVGTSCGSGVTAAQASLALAEAGFDSLLYVGSWSEWISDPDRPRALGPDPG